MSATEVRAGKNSSLDRYLIRTLPALLLLLLLAMPFLDREIAGSLLSQTVVVLLVVLGAIDVLTLKVPNLIVFPAIAFVLLSTAVVDAAMLSDAVLGGAVAMGLMFFLALVARGAMGMGDVKLACLIGCSLGLMAGITALALSFVLGGLTGIVLIAFKLRGRKDAVPFAPFLALSAIFLIALSGSLTS